MAKNLAEQLIRRMATDPVFREQLTSADPARRRALLDAGGFHGVEREERASAVPGFIDMSGLASVEALAAVATSGVATSGAATSGVATSGASASGVATSGAATSGVATSGASASGVATSGAVTSASVAAA